ncbi:hypothetical protein HN011_000675 [Eciton burchellii]|nr:hypothetical protein HN011_000675 [Eciton burchellii]
MIWKYVMLINIKPVSKKYSNEFSLELDQSECSVSMAHSQSMKYDLKLKKSPDHDGNCKLFLVEDNHRHVQVWVLGISGIRIREIMVKDLDVAVLVATDMDLFVNMV